MNSHQTYGGEGGIRTPDSLATMSDFESGAFNRALPPLRISMDLGPGRSAHIAKPVRPSTVYRPRRVEATPIHIAYESMDSKLPLRTAPPRIHMVHFRHG